MDLLLDGSHGQKLKATIYSIYKVLELQEKFGWMLLQFKTWIMELSKNLD